MLEYKLKRSSKSKNVKILINHQGEVTVTAPNFISLKIIEKFVLSHQAWINEQKSKTIINKKIWTELDKITIFEKEFIIRVWKLKSTPPYRLTQDSLWLRAGELQEIDKSLPKIIICELKKLFEQRLEYINNLGPNNSWKKLTIRSQKSRWGSYSSNGTLSFNWKLSLCPLEIIDYVIIHELCHINEHNHSANFWHLVESFDPKFKHHRTWLKNNGQSLI